MTTARILNEQLIVEGSPLGLSSCQIAVRKEKNLFKIDTVYVYKFILPKYLKGKEMDIVREATTIMDRVYDNRLVVNKEVGKYFFDKEQDNSLIAVLFVENAIFDLRTAREFRKVIDIVVARVKRPHHAAWKEARQLTKSVSYVKPSQVTE